MKENRRIIEQENETILRTYYNCYAIQGERILNNQNEVSRAQEEYQFKYENVETHYRELTESI